MKDSYDLTPLMMTSRIKNKDKNTSQSPRFNYRLSTSPSPGNYNTKSFLEQSKITKNGPSIDQ